MARRKVTPVDEMAVATDNTLDILIPQYAENKAMLDDYKKICDDENKMIKNLMQEGSYKVAGYKATKTVSTRESMNEEKLLDVANKNSYYLSDIIKTKAYIDMDKLEALLYKGNIPEHVLMEIDKCRESKEVVTLKISKVKEKKDAEN